MNLLKFHFVVLRIAFDWLLIRLFVTIAFTNLHSSGREREGLLTHDVKRFLHMI